MCVLQRQRPWIQGGRRQRAPPYFRSLMFFSKSPKVSYALSESGKSHIRRFMFYKFPGGGPPDPRRGRRNFTLAVSAYALLGGLRPLVRIPGSAPERGT